jgi:hypothetical protein
MAISEIHKVSVSVYFVSEGQIAQPQPCCYSVEFSMLPQMYLSFLLLTLRNINWLYASINVNIEP